jgi:hypothetical protein
MCALFCGILLDGLVRLLQQPPMPFLRLLGGPQCFSCDEVKGQSGLGGRQAKVTPQQISGLVHHGSATI